MTPINAIFDNLDMWRNLPAYQLERRADIFFSIYLAEILSHKFGLDIEGVIPEFPIRIGTIHHNTAINQSFKVDYLAKAKDKPTILFVELKTDESSRCDKQDLYLERAKQAGLVKLLDGVRQIYKATISKKKYKHLLGVLQDFGFIAMDKSGHIEVTQADYVIQIVYIQPNNPNGQDNVITFAEISEILEKHGDELSLRFSKFLLKWADVRAGEQ